MRVIRGIFCICVLLCLVGCSDKPKETVEAHIKNLIGAAHGDNKAVANLYEAISLADKEAYDVRGRSYPLAITPMLASLLTALMTDDVKYVVHNSENDNNNALVFVDIYPESKKSLKFKYKLVKEKSEWKIKLSEVAWEQL
jgi:hypothetical protein